MTKWDFRLLVIYPLNELAAVRNYVNTDIDPDYGGKWMSAELSPSGFEPATHGWASFQATPGMVIKFATVYANRLGVGAMSGNPLVWFASIKTSLRALGVYVSVSRIDNDNIDIEEALTTMGLKTIIPSKFT